MIVYSVSVQVKEGFEKDFIKACKANHKETRKESGNLRFDVIRNTDDPTLFMLYEVYRSDEAVKAHKETKHYKEWRNAVEPWMARERHGTKYTPVVPSAEEEWYRS